MWKDFFYYSRSERRAVYVLLTLIVIFVVMIVVFPFNRPDEGIGDMSVDSLRVQKTVRKEKDWDKKSHETKTLPVVLAEFDPNLADSVELLRLGLPSYVVRNVLKYRAKGGKFSTPESFARIYGLTENQFETLKPYIRISEAFKQKKPKRVDTFAVDKRRISQAPMRIFKYPEGTLVDVNLADTTELKKIPGIGSGIAKAIVSYRERLGGFHSLEQLQEIKFVTPELLEWFKLDSVMVRKLNINKGSLDRLRAHPYLNFYQAKVILEHRRMRGKISNLSQLSLYEEFTEKDLIRLAPYVCFD